MSDQFLGKVTSDLDPFKKILSYIPGFKGYIERRAEDADKRYARRWQSAWSSSVGRISLQRDFINSVILPMSMTWRSGIKLRTFADRMAGNARLFGCSMVKINEEEFSHL
jgi:hypothetical protein